SSRRRHTRSDRDWSSDVCSSDLGFPDELIEGRILPGAALSILVGNLFYAWQGRRLARQTGRTDVTALPYGINTPSVVAFIFLIKIGRASCRERVYEVGVGGCDE